MSTKRDKLKTYFETGDRPTEEEFEKFIDSGINQEDDEVYVKGQGTTDPKKIGIGVRDAQEKLHVNGNIQLDGHLKIKGDIVADDSEQGSQDFLSIKNNGQIQFFGKNHPNRGGDVFILPDKESGSGKVVIGQRLGGGNWRDNLRIDSEGDFAAGYFKHDFKAEFGHGSKKVVLGSSSGQSTGYGTGYVGMNILRNHANQNWFAETDGYHNGASVVMGDIFGRILFKTFGSDPMKHGDQDPQVISDLDYKESTRMIINQEGNIGIGTNNPGNRLEVSGVGNTGLRLPTGSSDGFVLVSKNGGDATWERPEALTEGLWKILPSNPNNIGNGNIGNVGIGIDSPTEKLHVSGTMQLETRYNDIIRFYDPEFDSSNPNPPSVGVKSPFTIYDKTGSRGFRFWTGPTNEKGGFETLKIEPEGNLRINDKAIYLRGGGDKNHGLAFFGDSSPSFAGINVNGPVLFGYSGGALGSFRKWESDPAEVEKVALQWFRDKSVDFKGRLRVKGHAPILMKRYYFRNEGNGELSSGRNLGIDARIYGAAIVSGFSFDDSDIPNQTLRIFLYTRIVNNQWHVFADSRNANSFSDPEKWNVDILFVKKELVELQDSGNVGNPFNSNLH